MLDQLLNRHRRPPFVDEGRTGTTHQTVRSNLPISCVPPNSSPSCAVPSTQNAEEPVWRGKVNRTLPKKPDQQGAGFNAATLICRPVILLLDQALEFVAFEGVF